MKLTGRLRLLCAGLVCGACLAIGLFFGDAFGRGANKSKSENVAIGQEKEIDFADESFSISLSQPDTLFLLRSPQGYIFDYDPVADNDESVAKLKDWIQAGDYDRVIETVKSEIENGEASIVEKDGANFRDRVHLLAVALELKGEWDEALRFYSFLYPHYNELFSWVLIRARYSNGQSEFAFVQICEMIRNNYSHYPVDDVIKDLIKHSDDHRSEALHSGAGRDVYRLRDQLLQITNPKLHYELDARDRKSLRNYIEPNQKALEVFKGFMETEREKYMSDSRHSAQERELCEQSMIFVRKLCKLPY